MSAPKSSTAGTVADDDDDGEEEDDDDGDEDDGVQHRKLLQQSRRKQSRRPKPSATHYSAANAYRRQTISLHFWRQYPEQHLGALLGFCAAVLLYRFALTLVTVAQTFLAQPIWTSNTLALYVMGLVLVGLDGCAFLGTCWVLSARDRLPPRALELCLRTCILQASLLVFALLFALMMHTIRSSVTSTAALVESALIVTGNNSIGTVAVFGDLDVPALPIAYWQYSRFDTALTYFNLSSILLMLFFLACIWSDQDVLAAKPGEAHHWVDDDDDDDEGDDVTAVASNRSGCS